MISVRTPQPHEYQAALQLLYSGLDQQEQQARVGEVLRAIHEGELSPQGLLLAEADGRPVGAILSAVQRDKTAFVWPPAVPGAFKSFASRDVADALLAGLSRRLDDAGVWLGQCLLDPSEAHDREVMSRNGFGHLTDLCYLERTRHVPFPDKPEVRFETVAYDPLRNRARFVRLLEETYRGTQDCPELSGLRPAEAALDGHRLSGEFDPSRWKIFCVGGADVGILLLNDHPEQDAWEIVYLGIAEGVRGRGYGCAMLLEGCRNAGEAGRGSVLVAVDCRNIPARKIYNAAGFAEIGVKSVHARIIQRPASQC